MITSTTRNLSVLLILLVICAGCDSANVDSAMEDEETVSGDFGEVVEGNEAKNRLEEVWTQASNGDSPIKIYGRDGELSALEVNQAREELHSSTPSDSISINAGNQSDITGTSYINVEQLSDTPGSGSTRRIDFVAVGTEINGLINFGWMKNRKSARIPSTNFQRQKTSTCYGNEWIGVGQCQSMITYYISGDDASCSMNTTHSGGGLQIFTEYARSGANGSC